MLPPRRPRMEPSSPHTCNRRQMPAKGGSALGRRGKCLRMRPGKGPFRGVACSPEAKPAPPGVAGNTVNQNRAKPCPGRLFGLYRELESQSQKDGMDPAPFSKTASVKGQDGKLDHPQQNNGEGPR